MGVNPRSSGTTTLTLKDGVMRCRKCNQKSGILTLDANGKYVCADCAGSRAVPAKVVEPEERRASETAAD